MSTSAPSLEDLAQRVSALENELASGLGDTLQQNFATVTPGQGVSAAFAGKISAQGIILPAGVGAAPGPVNQVIWERTSDGAQLATFGLTDSLGDVQFEHTIAGAAGDSQATYQIQLEQNGVGASMTMEAIDPSIGNYASVELAAQAAGGQAQQVYPIDSNGDSSFVRLPPGGNGRLFMDNAGGSYYQAQYLGHASGSTQSVTINWPQNMTPGPPLGSLVAKVHGTSTNIALPWTYNYVGNEYVIVVTNQTGFTVDWTWYGFLTGD